MALVQVGGYEPDFLSHRTAKAWARSPQALVEHLERLVEEHQSTGSQYCDQSSAGFSVQTKYDGHRVHVHIQGKNGRIERAYAKSRVAKSLVHGAKWKWEQKILPHLTADKHGRFGRALQSSRPGGGAFDTVFECELCSRLDRSPGGDLHEEVSSLSVTTACLVVFDIHSEAHCAWHELPLHLRLARLDALRSAMMTGESGEQVLDPFVHWARRWDVPPSKTHRVIKIFVAACAKGLEGCLVKPLWGSRGCLLDIKLKENLLRSSGGSRFWGKWYVDAPKLHCEPGSTRLRTEDGFFLSQVSGVRTAEPLLGADTQSELSAKELRVEVKRAWLCERERFSHNRTLKRKRRKTDEAEAEAVAGRHMLKSIENTRPLLARARLECSSACNLSGNLFLKS